MLECERLFGAARGREIQELAEAVTGGDCPCLAGTLVCPLAALYQGAAPPGPVLPTAAAALTS